MTRAGPFLAAVLAVGLAGGAAARARSADAAEPPPAPAARAAYWLDRIARGPEPTTYPIRTFHQTLLDDAIAQSAATPDETLALLADGDRRARLTSQDDANPWHAILEVLRQIGSARPEVARAWALPALERPLLTLRRAAIPALAALHSPADGPALLAEFERDADDRVAGPASAKALLALGPPWDAAAARVAYERGVADAPGGGGFLWDPMTDAVAEAKTPGAQDLLAWWAALTAVAGPRARPPQGRRAREGSPAAAYASPEDLTGIGRGAAARARAALAEAGVAGYGVLVERDAGADDPLLQSIATESKRRAAGPAERPAIRDAARAFLDAARVPESGPPRSEEARALVRALGRDPDAAATALLRRFVFEAAPALHQAMLEAYDELVRRGAKPVAEVVEMLASPDSLSVDRALALIRPAADAVYLGPLLAWMESPARAAARFQGRRLWLHVLSTALAHGGVDSEVLADGVRRAVEWAKDPADPSAAGLRGVLLDLGPPGLAAVADGLRGPDRASYLALLQPRPGRPLPPAIEDAVLAPIDRDMPTPARRAALDAVFFTAGGDSAEGVRALARRLDGPAAADAEMVARIVENRAASDR